MTAPKGERDVITELNRVRLEDNLSYRKLAKAIGGGMKPQTLQSAITDRSVKPYDRTLFLITEFLDGRKARLDLRDRRRAAKRQEARA